MSERPVVCFYHKDCVDGTTAAAVVLKKFPEASVFPVGFDSAEKDLELAKSLIATETLIFYVDNAIGLEKISELGNEVVVIDHHVSESEVVKSLVSSRENITYIFDEEESGASLTWKYFFTETAIPTVVLYTRDIDLHKNELLPQSNWAHLYISPYRNKPEVIVDLLVDDSEDYLEVGKVLAEYVDDEVARTILISSISLRIADWTVPAYNITNHQSKAGLALVKNTGGAVILYTIFNDKVRLSIRSHSGHVPNALDIATVLGGGGHPYSAGAGVKRNHFFSLLQP